MEDVAVSSDGEGLPLNAFSDEIDEATFHFQILKLTDQVLVPELLQAGFSFVPFFAMADFSKSNQNSERNSNRLPDHVPLVFWMEMSFASLESGGTMEVGGGCCSLFNPLGAASLVSPPMEMGRNLKCDVIDPNSRRLSYIRLPPIG